MYLLVNFLYVISCVPETDQTLLSGVAQHSSFGMLEASLSQMLSSTDFHQLCTILQDLKCSHLGRPCILSSVVCFTAEVLPIPQFQFFRLNTNVLLPGPPQTVFYPASVALPLRYIWQCAFNHLSFGKRSSTVVRRAHRLLFKIHLD